MWKDLNKIRLPSLNLCVSSPEPIYGHYRERANYCSSKGNPLTGHNIPSNSNLPSVAFELEDNREKLKT